MKESLFFFLIIQLANILLTQIILQNDNFHNDPFIIKNQTSPCNIITDCFNCTMFTNGNTNCAWENNQCVTTYNVK
jgi:hypothetical protein